ncbi:MAG: hypothetical protein RI560_03225 [Natronomonas sp.]|uniref:hypothetical protein n=1 Tax=Natronomonas TaxID=63743 RepID=UPI001485B320|nr:MULTISPECIES: hypothetical protein [Natronomonas]MDR9380670.1 hypothetical protein [Natronomonas sp.]MDR9430797.1 hypothetical protein [Natronomonas sp.]
MNQTAILHITAALLAGGSFFLDGNVLTIGLLALAGVLFVAGIVIARRGDDSEASDDV